jgi:hypothetical protein
MRTVSAVIAAVVTLLVAGPALAKDAIKVDCNKGKTIKDALKHADPGDTIRVTGVCHERITIKTNDVTLDGQGSAVIDGGGGSPIEFSGVITIEGVQGVKLVGLTVQNGPGEGILGRRGAAFHVERTIVQNNPNSSGIAVADHSAAELTGVTLQQNAGGLDVFTSSSAVIRGATAMTQNTGAGITINGLGVVEIRGANVNASDNDVAGVVVGSGQLAIFGFAASAGSTLTASGNGFAGVIVNGSQLSVYPAATVTASNNGEFGLLLANGGFATTLPFPVGGAKFLIANNRVGIKIENGTGVLFQGGQLTVTGNAVVGLSADGAGTVTILSESATPSSISGNTLDVDLKFGTRAHFNGVTIGSIACDNTVLSQGTTVCPP